MRLPFAPRLGKAKLLQQAGLTEGARVDLHHYLDYYGHNLDTLSSQVRAFYVAGIIHHDRLVFRDAIAECLGLDIRRANQRDTLWETVVDALNPYRRDAEKWKIGQEDIPVDHLRRYAAQLRLSRPDLNVPPLTDLLAPVRMGIARTITYIRVMPPKEGKHTFPDADDMPEELGECWRKLRRHVHYRNSKPPDLNQHALDLVADEFKERLWLEPHMIGSLKRDIENLESGAKVMFWYWPFAIFRHATRCKIVSRNHRVVNSHGVIWNINQPGFASSGDPDMKWDDIDPELLASSRKPISEDPAPGGIPLPEELLRNRREWAKIIAQPDADLSATDVPADHRRFLRTRWQKPLPLISSAIAALLLIGVIGLLVRQQTITNRQFAQLQAELAERRQQNTKMSAALAVRDSELAELRRQAADPDEIRRQLQSATSQLEALRNKPSWPPDKLILTGVAEQVGERGDGFNFIVSLNRRGRSYAGFYLPILKEKGVPKPVAVEATIVSNGPGIGGQSAIGATKADQDTQLIMRYYSVLPWPKVKLPEAVVGPDERDQPKLTNPDDPPVRTDTLILDIRKRTFSGSIDGVNVYGEVTF